MVPGVPSNREDRLDMWTKLENYLTAHRARRTRQQYLRALREFCTVLRIEYGSDEGIEAFRKLKQSDIDDYVNWAKARPGQTGRISLAHENVSLATVSTKLLSLKAVFDVMIELEVISANPLARTAKQFSRHKSDGRRETQMVDFAKVEELMRWKPANASEQRDLALIAAMFGGALRRNEAVGVRMRDVSEQNQNLYLHLRCTKNGTTAKQQILPWAAPVVMRHVEARRAEGAAGIDPVFSALDRRSENAKPLSTESAYLIFKQWMRRIGVPEEVGPHAARATTITLLLERGLDHRTVQKFSRHASVDMVQRYDKLRDRDDSDVFAAIELNPSQSNLRHLAAVTRIKA